MAKSTDWLRKVVEQQTPECIEWPFHRGTKGYGDVRVDGRYRQATHLALEMAGLPRPAAPGNQALHSCDNPPCVNPAHLSWGTPGENNTQAFARGRTNEGEHHPMHRLTTEQVREIRSRDYTDPGSVKAVAAEFGIHLTHVYRILDRTRWSHVP
jgi:hypothetical protein